MSSVFEKCLIIIKYPKDKILIFISIVSFVLLIPFCNEIDKEGYGYINLKISGESAGVNDLGIELKAVYAILGNIYFNEENNPVTNCNKAKISICDYYLVDLFKSDNNLLINKKIMSNRYKGFSFNISYDASEIGEIKIHDNITNNNITDFKQGVYIKGIFPIVGEKEYIIKLDKTINLADIPGKVLVLTKDSNFTIDLTVRLQEWLIGIDYFESDDKVISILKKNIEDITSYEYIISKE